MRKISICIGAFLVFTTEVASATILTSGSVGTAAPPATLGPYTMTAFPDDLQPEVTNVATVASPLGGSVAFSPSPMHFDIPVGWSFWSHGYSGDVYWTITAHQITMTLPAGTRAFYFYAEPSPLVPHQITAMAQDGTPLVQSASGASGATYFGFFATGASILQTITVQCAVDFAVGEFGIAVAAPVMGDLNGDGVVNTLDLGILLSSWSIPPTAPACGGSLPCPADINGDGFVNTLDLGILLSNWTL